MHSTCSPLEFVLITSSMHPVAGSRTKTDDVWWQWLWGLEVWPIGLFEQFEREFELVEERQAVDRVGDRRLLLHDVLHMPQSSPGSIWREHASQLPALESPDLGD